MTAASDVQRILDINGPGHEVESAYRFESPPNLLRLCNVLDAASEELLEYKVWPVST